MEWGGLPLCGCAAWLDLKPAKSVHAEQLGSASTPSKQLGLGDSSQRATADAWPHRWGNRKSLVDDPAAAGLDVRAELLKYYK